MTDYTSKTDNEIDRMVSAITGSNEGLDYCSDWGAIGPIIHSNNIRTVPECDGRWAANPVRSYTYDGEIIYGSGYTDKNPMRAAAICFLMMKA